MKRTMTDEDRVAWAKRFGFSMDDEHERHLDMSELASVETDEEFVEILKDTASAIAIENGDAELQKQCNEASEAWKGKLERLYQGGKKIRPKKKPFSLNQSFA